MNFCFNNSLCCCRNIVDRLIAVLQRRIAADWCSTRFSLLVSNLRLFSSDTFQQRIASYASILTQAKQKRCLLAPVRIVPQARLNTSVTSHKRIKTSSVLPQASQRSASHMRPAVVCPRVVSSITQEARNAT